MAYRIEFAQSVQTHFRFLTPAERRTVMEAIQEQLSHQPFQETRNRKLLRPNLLASWELRVGELRVFYELAAEEPNLLRVLAVGRKEGNRLFIAGKAVTL